MYCSIPLTPRTSALLSIGRTSLPRKKSRSYHAGGRAGDLEKAIGREGPPS